jgi:hypothetical protein
MGYKLQLYSVHKNPPLGPALKRQLLVVVGGGGGGGVGGEGPRSRCYGRTATLGSLCNPMMKMISFIPFSR